MIAAILWSVGFAAVILMTWFRWPRSTPTSKIYMDISGGLHDTIAEAMAADLAIASQQDDDRSTVPDAPTIFLRGEMQRRAKRGALEEVQIPIVVDQNWTMPIVVTAEEMASGKVHNFGVMQEAHSSEELNAKPE